MTDKCKGCDVFDARICVSCKRKATAKTKETDEMTTKYCTECGYLIGHWAGCTRCISANPEVRGDSLSEVAKQSFTIKFKKLHPDAVIPTRATDGSAGFDLYIDRIEYCPISKTHTFCTGVSAAIPAGYVGLLVPRSSCFKYGLSLSNNCGIIDSDFRGEIRAKFYRIKDVSMFDESQQRVCLKQPEHGERIAQLVVVPCITQAEEVDNLDETERGAGGFGHSGR